MLHLLPALTLATLVTGPDASEAPLSLTAELAARTPAPAVAPREEGADTWDFSYTFVEVGTSFYDPELDVPDFEDDVDVYYAKASLGLLDFLYLFAGYENQDFKFENSSTDLIRLGAGVHLDLAPRFDLVGDIAWLYSDLSSDLSELDDTTNGYEVRVGGRWMLLPWSGGGLELNGGGTYRELEDQIASDDKLLGWDVGARLHFLGLFSVGAAYAMMEDDDAAILNARVSF